jgi:hypothetical protein
MITKINNDKKIKQRFYDAIEHDDTVKINVTDDFLKTCINNKIKNLKYKNEHIPNNEELIPTSFFGTKMKVDDTLMCFFEYITKGEDVLIVVKRVLLSELDKFDELEDTYDFIEQNGATPIIQKKKTINDLFKKQ